MSVETDFRTKDGEITFVRFLCKCLPKGKVGWYNNSVGLCVGRDGR